jgi:hypothetical protein
MYAPLGFMWGPLGRQWGRLELQWGHLGLMSGRLGLLYGSLGLLWGPLGLMLGASGATATQRGSKNNPQKDSPGGVKNSFLKMDAQNATKSLVAYGLEAQNAIWASTP